MSRRRPSLSSIDDAHWADLDSLRALLFVVRRLVGERVLTVLAERSEDAHRLAGGTPPAWRAARTGTTIRLSARFRRARSQSLAAALGVPQLSARVGPTVCTHTPRATRCTSPPCWPKFPNDRWQTWEPMLPAPRAFATQVVTQIGCLQPAGAQAGRGRRRPGGNATRLNSAAALADVPRSGRRSGRGCRAQPAARSARTSGSGTSRSAIRWCRRPCTSSSARPGASSCTRRRPQLVDDQASALRHRVMAVTPPDPALVADLDAFARREAASGPGRARRGHWSRQAGSARTANSRERRLLKAVDAMIGAGDLIQAEAFAQEVVVFAPGPMRNATMGYLAVLRGRHGDAERLLQAAWERLRQHRRRVVASSCRATAGAARARTAPRRGDGRLGARRRWSWLRRVIRSGSRRRPCWGLGLGWQGRLTEGLAAYEWFSTAWPTTGRDPRRSGCAWPRVGCAWWPTTSSARDMSWHRRLPAALRAGLVRIAVWSYVWWRGRVSRWATGTKRPPTPTGRCRCWRSPDTAGCGRSRGSRR